MIERVLLTVSACVWYAQNVCAALEFTRVLQQQSGLTFLFVARNLSVVKQISKRVAVMDVGKVVEMTSTKDLFRSPRRP
jgi:ABC-type oligopeptide transport system ATPase subunit